MRYLCSMWPIGSRIGRSDVGSRRRNAFRVPLPVGGLAEAAGLPDRKPEHPNSDLCVLCVFCGQFSDSGRMRLSEATHSGGETHSAFLYDGGWSST